jgi:hypothetical protein
MSLFPDQVIDDVSKSVFWADCMIRSDLAIGVIANENDYTSNLTSEIRRQINSKNRPYLKATSLVLKPTVERKLGCDASIILSNTKTKEFKVCLFEAKLPRLHDCKHFWDSFQPTIGQSHFSGQVQKQLSVSKIFAVWEMFYCDYHYGKQPNWMNYNTSSCVWHSEAYSKVQTRTNSTRWTNTELEGLLTDAAAKYPTQIDNMIKEVCLCNQGKVFTGNDYFDIFNEYGFPLDILLIEFSDPQEIEHDT